LTTVEILTKIVSQLLLFAENNNNSRPNSYADDIDN